ncbi:MAG: PAS domain-containing protein [Ahniella sp.]|nr:PAS domain-containing protein [Ahniella sp.]
MTISALIRGLLASMLVMCAAIAMATPLDRNQVRFRSMDIDRGLSSSTARDLAQDATGQIWVATQDGLNRYDGYAFTVFSNDPGDPRSISADHATSLAAATDATLWVGTGSGGLNQLDLPTGRFTHFLAEPDGPLLTNHVADLLVDRRGDLWVATVDGGLQKRLRTDGTFSTVRGDADCLKRIRHVLELAAGDLLIACSDRLLRIDGTSGALSTWPDPALGNWPDELTPTALAELPDGRIMVGDARAGLLEFAGDGRLIRRHRHQRDNPASLVDDQIIRLLVTSRGELWIGTFLGLSHFLGEDRFLNFRHDSADNASLPANRIPSLLEDRDGLLWVGTWTAGIALHNPSTRSLRLLRHRQNDPLSLPSNPVRTLMRDGDGTLWLGVSEGGGLVHLDAALNVVERFQHDPADEASLPDNSVQAILRRRNGELWVATANGGVAYLPSGSRRFVRLRGAGLGLESAGARALVERTDGSLWVGTDDAGLLHRCSSCDQFSRFGADPALTAQQLTGNFINTLHEDRKQRLWVGFNGIGLALIDEQDQRVRQYRHRATQSGSLPSDVITDLLETASGTVWIATQGAGIVRINEGAEDAVSFDVIGKRDGLSANAIGSLIEDGSGKLWIASIVGIDELDPVTRRVRNLEASDGFDRSGYFIGSNVMDPDGRIYFGGLLGLVVFHPKDFRESGRAPTVTLTDIVTVGGTSARADRRQRRHAAYLDELVLGPQESVWSVSFSTMDFLGPENTRYQFRLEGLNDQWLDLPRGQRTASFTHVPFGRYQLLVRAQAAASVDYGPVKVLPVFLEAPWWRRPIAWFAYVVLALGLFSLFAWRVRSNLAERARQQDVIAANERRLRFSLWGSRDELWDYDVPSRYVRRDNALANTFSPEIRDGGDIDAFAELIHPDDRLPLAQALADHIAGRSEYFEASFRARNDQGDWAWFLQRGQAVERDADGKALHLIGTTRDISSVKQVEEALRLANEQLEARVAARTRELTEANDGLKEAMTRLRDTQSQLIESEKLASLGGLVAGVAHEINTPLGICITAASHLKQSTEELRRQQERGAMTRSNLEQYEQDAIEAARLILQNLERAVHLVRSFKQVAVDQGSEERRSIDLAQYLGEVVFALNPMLKRTPHRISVDCPPGLVIDTFPGAIYQIVVNFVSNSIAHAFPEGNAGHMSIRVLRLPDGQLALDYGDDGIGADAVVLKRIFEPFFTTKRGRGGSGLGMHIVYNLVTKLLRGTITVHNGPGLQFRIVLPVEAP